MHGGTTGIAMLPPTGSSALLGLVLTGIAVTVVAALLCYRFATRRRRSR
ncbi:hypothetical protein ABH927_005839 [Planotetraspora sp. GP83]